jgi:transcriptional regulator with XRE-family HTH domain
MTRPHQPRTRPERTAADTVRQLRRGLAAEIRTGRQDSGLSRRQLAATAGVSPSTLRAIELDEAEPSLQVLARVGTSLGMSLSVRLFPGTGPLTRDHLQAAMLNALLGILDKRWRARPEVAVRHPVRGVIDLVLDEPPSGGVVACEAHSELRRLEQQLRWSRAKADALATDAWPIGRRGRRVARVAPCSSRGKDAQVRRTALAAPLHRPDQGDRHTLLGDRIGRVSSARIGCLPLPHEIGCVAGRRPPLVQGRGQQRADARAATPRHQRRQVIRAL